MFSPPTRTRIVGALLVLLTIALLFDTIRHSGTFSSDEEKSSSSSSSSFSRGAPPSSSSSPSSSRQSSRSPPLSTEQRIHAAEKNARLSQRRYISLEESEQLFSSASLPPLYLDKKRFSLSATAGSSSSSSNGGRPSLSFRLLRRTAVFDRDRPPTMIIQDASLGECWYRCVKLGPQKCSHFSRTVSARTRSDQQKQSPSAIHEPLDQTQRELMWQEQHPKRMDQPEFRPVGEAALMDSSCGFARRQFAKTHELNSNKNASEPASPNVAVSASAASLLAAEIQSSQRWKELCLLHSGIPNLTPHPNSEVWLPDLVREDTSIAMAPPTLADKKTPHHHNSNNNNNNPGDILEEDEVDDSYSPKLQKKKPARARKLLRYNSLPSSLVAIGVQVMGRSRAVEGALAGMRTWLRDEPNVAVFFDRRAYHVGPLVGVLEAMATQPQQQQQQNQHKRTWNHHHPHFACVTPSEILRLFSHLDSDDIDDVEDELRQTSPISATAAVNLFFPINNSADVLLFGGGDAEDEDVHSASPSSSAVDNLTEFLSFKSLSRNADDDTDVFLVEDDEVPSTKISGTTTATTTTSPQPGVSGEQSNSNHTVLPTRLSHHHLMLAHGGNLRGTKLQLLQPLGPVTLQRPAPGAGWQFHTADAWPDPPRSVLRNETISRNFGAMPAFRDPIYPSLWNQHYVGSQKTASVGRMSLRGGKKKKKKSNSNRRKSSASLAATDECFTQRVQGRALSFDLSRPMSNLFGGSGSHLFRFMRPPSHRFLSGGFAGAWKTLRVLDELALFFPTSSWYFVVEEHTFVLIRSLHYLLRLGSLSLQHRTARTYFGFTGAVNAIEFVNTRSGMLLPHSALHLGRTKFPLCVSICRQQYGDVRVACCMHAADVREAAVRTFWPMRFERAFPLFNFSVSASAAGFHTMADMRFEEYLVERAVGRKSIELLAAAAAHKNQQNQQQQQSRKMESSVNPDFGGQQQQQQSASSSDVGARMATQFYSRIEENFQAKQKTRVNRINAAVRLSLFDEVLTMHDIFYGVAFVNTSFCRK